MTQPQSLNDSGKNPLTTVNSATAAAAAAVVAHRGL